MYFKVQCVINTNKAFQIMGGLYPWGICTGGMCPGGYVLGGICPGDKCPGGKCPGGYMSGGVSVQGGICPGVKRGFHETRKINKIDHRCIRITRQVTQTCRHRPMETGTVLADDQTSYFVSNRQEGGGGGLPCHHRV